MAISICGPGCAGILGVDELTKCSDCQLGPAAIESSNSESGVDAGAPPVLDVDAAPASDAGGADTFDGPPPPTCGDAVCNGTETCGTCPVDCGSCEVCEPESAPTFCARLGGKCGALTGTDNCNNSRTVVSCGTCVLPETCGGRGEANTCGCTPESNPSFCARLGKNCGNVTGADNCGVGRTVTSCGTCGFPETCSGGGSANVCGCTPESNTAFCSRLGKTCGNVTGTDNCNMARSVASCGTCTAPQGCGGGGTANVCGAITETFTATVNESQWIYYGPFYARANTEVRVATSGSAGDVDLYVRLGAQPTGSTYDCRPFTGGSNESCRVTPTSSGQGVYVGVRGYDPGSSRFTITATYIAP